MDVSAAEIKSIQEALASTQLTLTRTEAAARQDIGVEVVEIRTCLENVYQSSFHGTTEVRTLLSSLEVNAETALSVGLSKHLDWLHAHLIEILRQLGTAQEKSEAALRCTEQYEYSFLDLREDVNKQNARLEFQSPVVAELTKNVQERLDEIAKELDEAREKLQQKEREIAGKARAVRQSQQKVENAQSAWRTALSRKQQAEAERARRKKHVKRSVLIGGLGVVLAPVTFGASLGATAIAGGVAGYKVVRMDEFETQAKNLEWTLQDHVKEAQHNDNQLQRLRREKAELQESITEWEAAIVSVESEGAVHARMLEETQAATRKMSTLANLARTVEASINDLTSQLTYVKQSLDHCSTAVNNMAVRVETPVSFAEMVISAVPVLGTGWKRQRTFEREVQVLRQAAEVLDAVHQQMPSILPADTPMLLDWKPLSKAGDADKGFTSMPPLGM